MSAPEATIRHYGHRYIHPYTAAEYPDAMAQLSIVAALRDYEAWSGREIGLRREFAAGLRKFYDPRLKTLRRYLPNVGKDKDKDAVDSWYLYHPLLNLGRLALDGDKRAERLSLATGETVGTLGSVTRRSIAALAWKDDDTLAVVAADPWIAVAVLVVAVRREHFEGAGVRAVVAEEAAGSVEPPLRIGAGKELFPMGDAEILEDLPRRGQVIRGETNLSFLEDVIDAVLRRAGGVRFEREAGSLDPAAIGVALERRRRSGVNVVADLAIDPEAGQQRRHCLGVGAVRGGGDHEAGIGEARRRFR